VKILVVGSSGFVGSNLNIIDSKIEFHGIDFADSNIEQSRSYSTYNRIDFLSSECLTFVSKLEPDFVVLLAGIQFTSPIQKRRNRESDFNKNILIAKQAMEILKQNPSIKKLIYISTDMVYGIQKSVNLDETTKPNPIGEYGRSKLAAEVILQEFRSKVIIFRPRLIVGPGRAGTIKLLSRFIYWNLPIPLIGKGNNRYQMLSVFDLWSAIYKSTSVEIHGVFNLGSDLPPTLNELFAQVLRNLGRKNLIFRLPQRITEHLLLRLDSFNLSPLAPEQFLIAGQDCTLSTNKFKNSTGWSPVYSDLDVITQILSQLEKEDFG